MLFVVVSSLYVNAETEGWISADIGFPRNGEPEQIQMVALSNGAAHAIDADHPASPQIIDRPFQDNQRDNDAAGSNNMLLLPCAFPDRPIPTLRDDYFTEMHDELRAYWLELSYGQLDIGTSAVVEWKILPFTLAAYENDGVTDALTRMFEDCTTAHESVDFSNIATINILLNDSMDSSWAGQRYAELDGMAQLWPITWNANWAWERASHYILKHEMGHLQGLSHSMGHGSEYGNNWDTMSHALSQHTIGYNKALLGWLDLSAETRQINPGSRSTHTLIPLATAESGVKLLTIPVVSGATDAFTVEFRQIGGYDKEIFGTSVVIHNIDYERVVTNPITNLNQIIPAELSLFTDNSIHDGDSLWTTGETFVTPEGVRIEIDLIDTNCSTLHCGTATVTVTNPGSTRFLPIVNR